MVSKYYLEAKRLDEEEGDFESALKMCNEGISHGDFECAYLKGIIIILYLDEEGISDAMKSFQIGAMNGHKECQYELAKILLGKEYENNPYVNCGLGLNWYFSSGLIEKSDIELINHAIEKFSKESKLGKQENSINFIKKCNDWIRIFNNLKISITSKSTLTTLYTCREDNFSKLVNSAINNSKTVKDLDSAFVFLKEFQGKKFAEIAQEQYEAARIDLYLKESPNYLDASVYLESLYQGGRTNYIEAIKKLEIYIGKSFLYGKNDATLDFEKARRYFDEIGDQHYCNEFDSVLSNKIDDFLNKKEFDYAFNFLGLFFDINKPTILNKKIQFEKDKITFTNLLTDAENGGYESIRLLVEAYLKGKGTPCNENKAIEWAKKLIFNYKDKWAFDIVFFRLFDNKDALKKLLIYGKENNITFDSSQEQQYTLLFLKKRLLIFDLDATVFDTDCLRIDRARYGSIFSSRLREIKYVKGFSDIFLNRNSKLYLGNFEVLIVTSGRESYVSDILSSHKEFSDFSRYPVIRTFSKKESLREFLSKHDYSDIYAFGDDEKDANIYSELKLKFYIVPNSIGYPNDSESIIKHLDNSLNNFRNNWLYELKKSRDGFQSEYFDDVVIYFKHYTIAYPERSYTPNIGSRKQVWPPFQSGQMTGLGGNKKMFIKNKIFYFANDFNDVPVNSNTIFCRVPGSSEIPYDSHDPISLLINEIIKRKGNSMNDGADFLERIYAVEKSHDGGERTVQKQLDSIKIKYGVSLLGKTVYLIDDISTTGTTLLACSHILYKAGASHVICFCLAKTAGTSDYPINEIK